MRSKVCSLVLAAISLGTQLVAAQDFSSTHNVTSLTGTWSSGTGAVTTGSAFAAPLDSVNPFAYPATTGIAFSFTDDGFFEEARYQYNANASRPDCAEAVVIWQHGTYEMHSNGSLTLDPSVFDSDGRIQVQVPDDCSDEPNILTYYSQWEIFNSWTITVDLNHAAYMLQMTNFDDSLFKRLYLTTRPPSMLPTAYLTAISNGSSDAIGGTNIS